MSNRDNLLIAEFNARRCEEAFAALVQQHVNLVFATALRQVGDRAAVEEITQNVFVTLAQSAGRLGSHPTIAGWLHQTTLNKSREWLRSELRRQKREQTAVSLAEAHAEGDSVWAPMVPLLDEALLQLRDADRAAVIMHFMEGRTFQEVGSILGVGEDAVRKRVSRCLEQLTKFFQRRGFSVPALSAGVPLFALASHTAPINLAASATSAGLAAHSTSASTLTLKGALKIMAWTKAKTAVVTGAAALLAIGVTTLTIITVQWLAHMNQGYVIYSQVQKNAQGYTYLWTVHNRDQSWGLDQFAVEVPINTRIMSTIGPAPYDNSDTNAIWTYQETREAQVDDHDGQIWLPAAKPGKKWILWWGQQSSSVYPSNSIATFSITTDAAVKPGTVENYAITYTPQNDPHYYHPFRSKVTGPAN